MTTDFDPAMDKLQAMTKGLSDVEIADLVDYLPPDARQSLLRTQDVPSEIPDSPIGQALELDSGFVTRDHTSYLSERITKAVEDVENGQSRKLAISLPPRTGKSTLCTYVTPIWTLRKHPEWSHVLVSHDLTLATSWGRQIRRTIEQQPELGLSIAPDAGAVSDWETVNGGSVRSRTLRGSLTGRGAKVLIIDDPVKDFQDAHSILTRNKVWDWYLSVALNRLEPPTLILTVMTRWHENDFVGRLLSNEYEGDPSDWEVISLPAIAEAGDLLDREVGAPLLSPIIDETPDKALLRWQEVKEAVGSYVFGAMYQQHPSPAQGSIFGADWWQFWTLDEGRAKAAKEAGDDSIIYFNPNDHKRGRWLDSWDCAFKGTNDSDFVVGQRWTRVGANRFLIDQHRERMTFTKTLETMEGWGTPESSYGSFVHERLVEDKANGTAIIDVLKDKVSGMIPINPTNSKEARARSITPECEAGNVYLPHPGDAGNEWVYDLLSELRSFPHDAHDDQVDALTQALTRLRDAGRGSVTVPGRRQQRQPMRSRVEVAQTGLRRVK